MAITQRMRMEVITISSWNRRDAVVRKSDSRQKSCRLFLNGLPSNTVDGKIKNIRTGNSQRDKALPVRYAVLGERSAQNDEWF